MKTRMMIATVLLLAATGAGSSHAAGVVSGNICSSATLGSAPISVSLDGFGATNASTSSQVRVNCALPTDGSSFTFIELIAFDRSTVANVSCTIKGWDKDGDLVLTTEIATTGGGPGSGVQDHLIFGNLPPNIPNTTAKFLTSTCTIPAAVPLAGVTWLSHIVGFRII